MLRITIMSGAREKRIPDTPDDYYNLYNQCWNDEPEARPTIEHIYDTLKELLRLIEKKRDNLTTNVNEGE